MPGAAKEEWRAGWLGPGGGRPRAHTHTVSCDEACGLSSLPCLAFNGSMQIGDGGLEGGGTSMSRNQ